MSMRDEDARWLPTRQNASRNDVPEFAKSSGQIRKASQAIEWPPKASSSGVERGVPGRKCFVLFFLHPEKTAGTTLRAILNRQAQRAEMDFISFLTTNPRSRGWMPYVRKLLYEPVDTNLRLAIEMHAGQGAHPVFERDVLRLIRKVRARYERFACTVRAVTLLRKPLDLYMSYFQHWAIGHLPYCAWSMPMDIQARILLGIAHKGTNRKPRDEETESNSELLPPRWSPSLRSQVKERALAVMNELDIVAVSERFDEFALLLAREIGLDSIAFRAANVRHKAGYVSAEERARNRVNSVIAPLNNMHMRQRRKSGSPTWLSSGCSAFGCYEDVVRGVKDGSTDPASLCESAGAGTFVARAVNATQVDDILYEHARDRFQRQISASNVTDQELEELSLRNQDLERRLKEELRSPEKPRGCFYWQDGKEKFAATHKCIGRDDQISLLPNQTEFEGCWYDIPVRHLPLLVVALGFFSFFFLSLLVEWGNVETHFVLVQWVFAPYERKWRCSRRFDPAKSERRTVPCWETCWFPYSPAENRRTRCMAGCELPSPYPHSIHRMLSG